MSRDTDYWSNDDRAVRRREELAGWDRLFTDVLYYGLSQILLFTFPVFWLVYQTPYVGDEAKAGASVALVVMCVAIGLFRGGKLRVGRPWPSLSNAKLGTGRGGYGEYLTRAVYLSCTFALAAYGGAFAHLASGRVGANVLLASLVAAGGIALLPYLTARSTRALAARFGYYAVSLAAASVGSSPLETDAGDPTAFAVVLFLAALAVLDCRALFGRLAGSR